MMRVELLLDRFQGVGEQLGPFSVVPGPMTAAERVIVCDRPASVDPSF